MYLDQNEADAIEAHVARVEQCTGVQIVAAIVDKSDVYVELPWKAFALGAALAGLAMVAADWLQPDWVTSRAALVHVVVILGAGGASALLAVFVPGYAVLFLRSTRRDAEVRQHAQSLFLRHELFKTRDRNGVLILVSRFERKVEILADVGLQGKVSEAEWRGVIARMAPSLSARRFAVALLEAFAAIEAMLAAKGFVQRTEASNDLPDRPIEETGRS